MRKQNMFFNHRKWNILAFRGRLMSLLVLTHSGVSPRPHLPQESRIFHLLGYVTFIVHNGLLYYFDSSRSNSLCFSLFIIRTIGYTISRCSKHTPLIGTEGGDSRGNSKRSSVGRTIVQSHEP